MWYGIMIVSLLFIFANGKFRCDNPNYRDPLQTSLGIWDLDGWSLTHFGMFATLGYQGPTRFQEAMALGVAWE